MKIGYGRATVTGHSVIRLQTETARIPNQSAAGTRQRGDGAVEKFIPKGKFVAGSQETFLFPPVANNGLRRF